MIYIYNLLLALLAPLMVPYAAWRLITGKESLSSYRQKLGRYDFTPPEKGGIWIHAVSVGETNTAALLVNELLKRRENLPITFSTSTAGGMETAGSKLEGKATLIYFPLDFPGAVRSALSFFSPRVVVLTETEIWPNFIHNARKSGIGTILINGRISDSSFRRYRLIRPLFRPFIRSIDRLLMQSEKDAERIIYLGAAGETPVVTGTMKFDGRLPDEGLSKEEIRRSFGIPENAKVVALASSHPGEDELFLNTIKKLSAKFSGLYPVIAPRHIHRAEEIRKLCIDEGFSLPRLRSENSGGPGSIMILDTLGELVNLYGAVDVAIIGGSFIPHGGQNPLEASGWKLPVIFGPHMQNFRDVSQKLVESGGAVQVAGLDGLTSAVSRWLESADECREAGLAGYNTILKNRGALHKTVEAIEELLEIRKK